MMELLSSCLLLISVVVVVVFRLLTRKPRPPPPKAKLPPGPWQLPIIGCIHHLFFSSSSLPHHIFRHLSNSYGDSAAGLLHLKLGEVSMVVASSPEAAREITKTHDANFATRPLFAAANTLSYGGISMSFAPYGDYWRKLRRICVSELLSAKRVLSFRSVREERVRELVRSLTIEAPAVVNLSQKLSSSINSLMASVAIGSTTTDDDDDHDDNNNKLEFIAAFKEALAVIGGFSVADLFPSCSSFLSYVTGFKARLERRHRNLDTILERIIRQRTTKRKRKKAEEEDFLDVLLRLKESGDNLGFELTNDHIKAIVQDMLGAGSETSIVTVEWAMTNLMRNPAVMRRAQEEVRRGVHLQRIKQKAEGGRNGGVMMMVREEEIEGLELLQLIIKETLRLHPPGPLLLPRECQEQCEILGYEIPKGTRVVINVWAMGRDPRYWEDPEAFKPERFRAGGQGIPVVDFKGTNFHYLPFGSGKRMCPGISMGLANVELALANLLYHFDWRLPPTDHHHRHHSLDMTENFGLAASKKFPLFLCPIPYTYYES